MYYVNIDNIDDKQLEFCGYRLAFKRCSMHRSVKGARMKVKTYTVERRFRVCREHGWAENKPGPWIVAGERPTRGAARELLAVLEAFNLSVGNTAEYRVNVLL